MLDPKSRMRELRTSGSVGGLGGNSQAYPTALGRRVEKAVSGGATTRYLLDGVQVVEEYDGSDAWQARYVYEDGIDRPRCMDRADIADVDGDQNTTEVMRFHYHQQALGCVTEMSEPGGAVVEWVTYDVYGLPTIRNQQGNQVSQSAIGNPYLYTGREYDPESGLYFYRARHYDPGKGRFLQRDPLGYPDSLTGYEYVISDPVTLLDPWGLDVKENQKETATERARRGKEMVQHARDLIAKYGNAQSKSNLEIAERNGVTIEFIPKGDPRWKQGTGIYDPASNQVLVYENGCFGLERPIWNIIETLCHELKHAADSVAERANGGRIPAAGTPASTVNEGEAVEAGVAGRQAVEGAMSKPAPDGGLTEKQKEDVANREWREKERNERDRENRLGKGAHAPTPATPGER